MKKSTENTATTKVCKVCGHSHPIENFRVHKNGYTLNKCKDCEKAAWMKTFTVTTGSGKVYEVSAKPVKGGRKVTSMATDKVLYVTSGVTRDQARSIFQAYANVSRTGISVSVVE